MDVSSVVAVIGSAGTLLGILAGVYGTKKSADKEAKQVQSAHEEALQSAQLEREKAVLTAQNESRTQASQAGEQLFQQLRMFISDLQKANNDLVGSLQAERSGYVTAMAAERARCDKEMADINAELVAANERWLAVHKLSISQEKRLGDIEIQAIQDRKTQAMDGYSGRRATDHAVT